MAIEGLEFEKSIIELEKKVEELKEFAEDRKIDLSSEINKLDTKISQQLKELYGSLTPWQKTQVARHLKRPRTLDYIGRIFEDFIEIHGDRLFKDDNAIIGGFAVFNGKSVVIIGHQKGKDTKDSIYRNFGMANPEGYRKALRIMKLAEKFKKPIISFVDTPAAYPGIGAEERGQAEAIARNLREMASLKTHIIVIVHGEGGSGGALGIAIGDKVLMMENAIYSVIPPEGCAAILWKNSARGEEAAMKLGLTAPELFKFKLIDEIVKEPLGGAHRNYDESALNMKEALKRSMDEILSIPIPQLLEKRYEKFRRIGEFEEIAEDIQDKEKIKEEAASSNSKNNKK